MRMVGALALVGSSVVDLHPCPSPRPTSNMYHKSSGHVANRHFRRPGSLELSTSLFDSRLSAKFLCGNRSSKKQRKGRNLVIVNEVAGQYEDSFDDVKMQITNYFTYKAVRTVLHQLYEMNPTKYRWFYDFVVMNKPSDAKRFIRVLGKEQHDLAERVMITRLHLYGKWIKKCNHSEIYQKISDQNLELMREHLMETVKWSSDDTNAEKIG